MEQALRTGKPAAEKSKLLAEARATYAEAQRVFSESEQRFDAEQKKYPKDQLDHQQSQARDVARRNLLHARLSLAVVISERRRPILPAGWTNLRSLRAAAEQYKALFDKYQNYLGVLLRPHRRGPLLPGAGRAERRVGALAEPLEQARRRAFREMKSRATFLAVQIRDRREGLRGRRPRGTAWINERRDADEIGEEGAGDQVFQRPGPARLAVSPGQVPAPTWAWPAARRC